MFRPDFIFESVASLDERFYSENGIRAVIFDIDDTLCPHGSFEPSELCRAAVEAAKSAGASVAFISNDSRERSEFFSPLVRKAHKPSKRGFLALIADACVSPAEALAVGDQLFTDIAGAYRAGMRTVLVKPISEYKNILISLKRVAERPLLKKYEKENTK